MGVYYGKYSNKSVINEIRGFLWVIFRANIGPKSLFPCCLGIRNLYLSSSSAQQLIQDKITDEIQDIVMQRFCSDPFKEHMYGRMLQGPVRKSIPLKKSLFTTLKNWYLSLLANIIKSKIQK